MLVENLASLTSIATPQAAEVSDNARDHSASSNSVRTMLKDNAESVPAPRPMTPTCIGPCNCSV